MSIQRNRIKKPFLVLIFSLLIVTSFYGCSTIVETEYLYSLDEECNYWREGMGFYEDYSFEKVETAEQAIEIADVVWYSELTSDRYTSLHKPFQVSYYKKEKIWVVRENRDKMNVPGVTYAIAISEENGSILSLWTE